MLMRDFYQYLMNKMDVGASSNIVVCALLSDINVISEDTVFDMYVREFVDNAMESLHRIYPTVSPEQQYALRCIFNSINAMNIWYEECANERS